jgi:hypothetical protein
MSLFQEKYDNAPKGIQEVIDSDDVSEILADIALKNGVGDDGLGNPKLGRLVGYSLVGMLHPKDFIPNLEKDLGVSNETARTIAKDVNEKVFAPVKDLLVEMYGLGKINSSTSEPSPVQKTGYNTSPELFEKKLSGTVLMQEIPTTPVPTKQDQKPL